MPSAWHPRDLQTLERAQERWQGTAVLKDWLVQNRPAAGGCGFKDLVPASAMWEKVPETEIEHCCALWASKTDGAPLSSCSVSMVVKSSPEPTYLGGGGRSPRPWEAWPES